MWHIFSDCQACLIFVIINVIASPGGAKQSQSVAKNILYPEIEIASSARKLSDLLAMTILGLSDSRNWVPHQNDQIPASRKIPRSLSPRPERQTMIDSFFFIFRASLTA